MKIFLLTIVMFIVSGCAAPQPYYDTRLFNTNEEETGLSEQDFRLSSLECAAYRDQHLSSVVLGNFGGWDGMRIFVDCMDKHGFRAVNYSVYFD